MISFTTHQGLLGFVRLLTTAVAAGWVGSPMSWSPDAHWLSYTVSPEPGPVAREPGWLFDTSRGEPGKREERGDGPPNPAAGPSGYRIWASQRDNGTSVLIEESAWPLTAPAWSTAWTSRSTSLRSSVPTSNSPTSGSTRFAWV